MNNHGIFKSLLKGAICLIIINFLLINPIWGEDILFPEPPGPFGVGIKNIELLDPTREQFRSHEKKRWMASVYYPTYKEHKTANYMSGTLQEGRVRGIKVLAHSILHAPMSGGQKFPLIIAMPGRGNVRQQYTILYEVLASHGYIIIAMDQPYVANFVRFPDGRKITLTLKDAWKLPRDRDYRYRFDDAVIAGAIQDIDFVLKHLMNFGDLSKAFDHDKIILMGHSLGGNVAQIKGFADKRIRLVVDIDSKITERTIYGHVGVPQNPDAKPVLFIRGMLQYQEDVGAQLTKISNSTSWAPKVQHSAFSDDAYLATKIPHYQMGFWAALSNWLFKIGPYFSDIDTSVGQYNRDEWFKTYPLYIVRWLQEHLNQSGQ